jgi:hypothetical protein
MTSYEIITAVFAGSVSISTVFYVIYTKRLTEETIKLRKAQTEPKISIYIQPDEESMNMINLIIQNIGYGPAVDISLVIEPEFMVMGKDKLSDQNFFKKIVYLSPGQKIKAKIFSMFDYEKLKEKTYKVRGKYSNEIGNKYECDFSLDFSQYLGLRYSGERLNSAEETLKKELPKISSALGNIVHQIDEGKI